MILSGPVLLNLYGWLSSHIRKLLYLLPELLCIIMIQWVQKGIAYAPIVSD